VRPRAGRAVVDAAVGQCRFVKTVDGGVVGRRERDVEAGGRDDGCSRALLDRELVDAGF